MNNRCVFFSYNGDILCAVVILCDHSHGDKSVLQYSDHCGCQRACSE